MRNFQINTFLFLLFSLISFSSALVKAETIKYEIVDEVEMYSQFPKSRLFLASALFQLLGDAPSTLKLARVKQESDSLDFIIHVVSKADLAQMNVDHALFKTMDIMGSFTA